MKRKLEEQKTDESKMIKERNVKKERWMKIIWKGEMNEDMEVNEKNMRPNNMDDEMMEENNDGE